MRKEEGKIHSKKIIEKWFERKKDERKKTKWKKEQKKICRVTDIFWKGKERKKINLKRKDLRTRVERKII